MRKILLLLKTILLMILPLGLYILILKKFTKGRLTNYAGIIGKDPIAYPVFYGVVLVDLNNMQI